MSIDHTQSSRPEDVQRLLRVVDGYNRATIGDTDTPEARDLGYGLPERALDSLGPLATANSKFEPQGRVVGLDGEVDLDLDAEWRTQVAADRQWRNSSRMSVSQRRPSSKEQNTNAKNYEKAVRTNEVI